MLVQPVSVCRVQHTHLQCSLLFHAWRQNEVMPPELCKIWLSDFARLKAEIEHVDRHLQDARRDESRVYEMFTHEANLETEREILDDAHYYDNDGANFPDRD